MLKVELLENGMIAFDNSDELTGMNNGIVQFRPEAIDSVKMAPDNPYARDLEIASWYVSVHGSGRNGDNLGWVAFREFGMERANNLRTKINEIICKAMKLQKEMK